MGCDIRRFREMDVRPMVADLHAGFSGQQVAGGIHDEPVRTAIGMPSNSAAARVRRVGGDAVRGQPEGVDRTAVAAHVHDVDLAIGRRHVQLGGKRLTKLLRHARVKSKSSQRHPGRQLVRLLVERRDQRWNRGSHPGTYVQPRLRLPKHQRMGVGINESRHERPAAQVALLAISAGRRSTVLERAGPEDAITQDCDCLDPERLGHGQDWSAAEDDWL